MITTYDPQRRKGAGTILVAVAAFAVLLLAVGCGSESSDGDGASGSSEQTGDDTATDVGANDPDYDAGLKPLVDQARADLAQRLGIDASEINLVLAELREWPDSSIGCPQPDMSYAPTVSDGSEMIFEADGTEYRYTTGGELYVPQFCPNEG